MKKFLLPFIFSLSFLSFSQNLIPNSDFITSKNIRSRGEISQIEFWNSANSGAIDIFTSSSPKTSVGIPLNYMGNQVSSSNYIGFIAYYMEEKASLTSRLQGSDKIVSTDLPFYCAYPQVELSTPLVEGQKYVLSFEISLSEKSSRLIDKVGALFLDSKADSKNSLSFNETPQIIFTPLENKKSTWQRLEGEFTAKGGEKHLIIGAFEGISFSDKIITAKIENDNKRAYYYINGGISLTKAINKDIDGDGFLDTEDECPNVYGTIKGCPDSDGDGIPDIHDKCPNIPGLKEFAGCPANSKDSDGDGFPDVIDECPKQKGTIRGCPDRDGDGIPDREDECPDEKGRKELKGCPMDKEDLDILHKASEAIYFNTSSAVIKLESYIELNKMIEVLNKNKDVHVIIEGHTDSQGDGYQNLKLSKARAKAVKEHLIERGIAKERLESEGYGKTKPIASNNTVEGREKNRRVVMIISSSPDIK